MRGWGPGWPGPVDKSEGLGGRAGPGQNPLNHGSVLAGNVVPRSQGRSERAKRSERAEQCSEHFWACSGHCTLDIVRWTSYVGLCTLDIVLILAIYPVVALNVTARNQNQN